MKPALLLVLGLLSVFACSADHDDAKPVEARMTQEQSPPPSVRDTIMTGQEAYNTACARCHEKGVDGAPITGKRADWEHRSQNWQAVLMEHANAGFFDMPAKGGQESLAESTVDAATEYMLENAYPKRLPD